MPSPLCEVKDGAGAYGSTTNGVNVTPANTIIIRLISQAGVDSWQITCASTDELSDADAVTAALTIDSLAKTATFTAPVAGRAYRFQSRVNGGVDKNGVAQSTYTTTFGIYTLTAGSLRVHAVDETVEAGEFGWGGDLNAVIRSGGGAFTAGGDLTGTSTNQTVAKVKGTTITTAGGALPVGAVLRTTAAGTADWGTLDLADADARTGVLPLANVASPTGTGLAKVSAGAWVSAAATLVNADVDAAAAIAGTKISPDFGSQTVQTTGGGYFGSGTRSATGDIRGPQGFTIFARTPGGGDHGVTIAGTITIGDSTNSDAVLLRAYSGGHFYHQLNGVDKLTIAANGIQIGAGAEDFGSGVGVIGIDNAGTNPSTNPTGGGILYSDAGAGKWRGSGGTVTTFGPADPHCPTCGRDFALEHQNDEHEEHLAICLPCLVDVLKAAGIDTKAFSIADKRGASKDAWDASHAEAKERERLKQEKQRNRVQGIGL